MPPSAGRQRGWCACDRRPRCPVLGQAQLLALAVEDVRARRSNLHDLADLRRDHALAAGDEVHRAAVEHVKRAGRGHASDVCLTTREFSWELDE